MDTRRRRNRLASETHEPPPARPVGAAEFAQVLAKLDAVLAEQHELRRLVHKLAVPVEVLDSATAAARIGVSVRTLERLTACDTFTDARAPERRVCGAPRVFYADEVDVYRGEGKKGVARLRRELGRN